MRQGAGGGTRLAAVAALCAAVLCGALPAPGQPAAVAADGTADPPSAYRTAEGAERTEGTASSTGAPELKARHHYTDAIGAGETLFYRVRLDEESNAHLSAVAALPPAGGTAYGDGIEVTLRSADGARCNGLRGTAGPGGFGLPVAATASRLVRPNASCQEAGEYLFTVERIGDAASGPGDWPLEISFLAEPGVTGGATEAPGGAGWSTEPPAASGDAGGLPRKVRGGTGFNDAAATGTGVWRDRLEPGETLFYRIPVDWGQRLRVTADVGGAELTGGAPHLGSGVLLRLHNTARTPVHEQGAVFDGQPKRLGFSTAPAAFGHRFGGTAKAGEMRFAGWYHLSVALTPEAAGHMEGGVDLTLRLAVEGEPQPGPAYDGDAAAAGFAVSDEDRERAAEGRATAPEHAVGETDGKTDGDGALRTVGFAGIGAGTVLLLGLVVWTLAARRRTAGSADTATTTAGPAVTAASGGMPHLPAPGRRPEHPLPGGPGPESTPPERHGGGYGQPPRH
ncbi:hypothetical protein LIX60_15415 [Streptomyces sp. S07_1.15]|uniref:hypothetical protein n=1 Tax=Streptomyces sp. S07_1.15 TaxID=2873925 RepID=UPI001D1366D0|nr:hypothetical protein [Streptomyces sp. S07_1.15]MCC3652826.1 hypothetical protein [Streptomyces sp. S07_1.15]